MRLGLQFGEVLIAHLDHAMIPIATDADVIDSRHTDGVLDVVEVVLEGTLPDVGDERADLADADDPNTLLILASAPLLFFNFMALDKRVW